MLSYPVIDRDRERVVEELNLARQIEATPIHRRKVDSRNWFLSSLVGREAIHTRSSY